MAKLPIVHVLGLGSIGTFAAHALAEIPIRPAVTLLLHRPSLLDSYVNNGDQINLVTRDKTTIYHNGYRLEVLRGGQWYHENNTTPTSDTIDHLVVCSKSTQTVDALRPLKHRLTKFSSVLFLQNGMGMIDAVNSQLFPDAHTRPSYIIGVISHGIGLQSPFNIVHTGFAATSLGLVPRDDDSGITANRYLLDALPLVPRLNATSYSFHQVLQIQLEKLAVNAFCNPVCALNDAKNGFLATLPHVRHALLTEISQIIYALPELAGVEGVTERFSVANLERTVVGILEKTADTTCSMVWDLRAGRKTEIQFINGYWARRAKEVGVPAPLNEKLIRQIQDKEQEFLERRRSQGVITT